MFYKQLFIHFCQINVNQSDLSGLVSFFEHYAFYLRECKISAVLLVSWTFI